MISKFGYATDELSRHLADEILFGQIAPGTHLSEAKLAERFSVSRTPVREALRQIVASGLAERRPHLGVFVTSVPAYKLAEMFELAADLEGVCARHSAVRMSRNEIGELRELCMQGKKLAERNQPDGYDAFNLDFHKAIFKGSHNTYLMDAALAARSRVLPYRRAQFRFKKRMKTSYAEHDDIVGAIAAGEQEKAERLMRDHVLASYQASQKMLDRISASIRNM